MRPIAIVAAAVLLAAPVAHAQERGVSWNVRQAGNGEDTIKIAARVPVEAPVTGAPYSADVVVSSTQTLGDGNHISRQETTHVFRDGQGRTRRELSGGMSVVAPGEPVVSTKGPIVSIVDPVAGYSYSLDAEHKIAWRTPIDTSKELLNKIEVARLKVLTSKEQLSTQTPTQEQKAAYEEALVKLKKEQQDVVTSSGGEPGVASTRRGVAIRPEVPLEHATLDGLAVEGHRTSETIPAGKIGNELPITITNEEWTSTDLKVLVLTKHNDPRTGESTYHLTNVVRAEPDPSLFVVPPDYTVKDTNIRRNNE